MTALLDLIRGFSMLVYWRVDHGELTMSNGTFFGDVMGSEWLSGSRSQ